MDYRIPFPEEQPEEGKMEEYSKILMMRLPLQIDAADVKVENKVMYHFPRGIQSEAGKTILAIDFLITWSGMRIGELFHLKEKKSGTMVTIKWVMYLMPKKELSILGKELHDEGLLRVCEEVKTHYFEKLALKRWKRRLEEVWKLRIEEDCALLDPDVNIVKRQD